MRVAASALAFALALTAIAGAPAAAATISILALPPVADRQPWATGIQGEAELPGLGGYDVRGVARVVSSLTDSYSLSLPGLPPTTVDTSFHFFQLGVTFSRSYFGRFDLYAGGGYAWQHAGYSTGNFAGFHRPATGGTTANGPTVEAGIRIPFGKAAQFEGGVIALFSQPVGNLCDTAGRCGAPDTRSVLTYPYIALGVHF
ncbi:MAG: hypothetical protein KGM44_02205 [bacterium]|nr:hypothetical protein [bacterium]